MFAAYKSAQSSSAGANGFIDSFKLRTNENKSLTGKDLIQPLLDNQLKSASPLVLPTQPSVTNVPLEQAIDIVKDAFTAAGERDIYTGDRVEIWIMTRDGVRKEDLQLKKD
jgi:20S proteasome subunit beta 6